MPQRSCMTRRREQDSISCVERESTSNTIASGRLPDSMLIWRPTWGNIRIPGITNSFLSMVASALFASNISENWNTEKACFLTKPSVALYTQEMFVFHSNKLPQLWCLGRCSSTVACHSRSRRETHWQVTQQSNVPTNIANASHLSVLLLIYCWQNIGLLDLFTPQTVSKRCPECRCVNTIIRYESSLITVQRAITCSIVSVIKNTKEDSHAIECGDVRVENTGALLDGHCIFHQHLHNATN